MNSNKQLLPSVARTLKQSFSGEKLRSFGIEGEVNEAAKQPSMSHKASWPGITARLNKAQARVLRR